MSVITECWEKPSRMRWKAFVISVETIRKYPNLHAPANEANRRGFSPRLQNLYDELLPVARV